MVTEMPTVGGYVTDTTRLLVVNLEATWERVVFNLVPRIRREVVHGKEYWVAPLRMIISGVLNGSQGPLLYPPDEVNRDADSWNDIPMVVYHPVLNGRNVSGRSPAVLQKSKIGRIYNAVAANGNLDAEGWFDVEATRRVDIRILDALQAGRPIGLSTGLYTTNVPAQRLADGSWPTHNGRPYHFVARNYRPDHLAILPDQKGACSLQDGCGVLVGNCDCDPAVSSALMDAWLALGYQHGLIQPAPNPGATATNPVPGANAAGDKPDMTPEKACKILEDGSVNGKPLTDDQKGMFGALCGKTRKDNTEPPNPNPNPAGNANPGTTGVTTVAFTFKSADEKKQVVNNLVANAESPVAHGPWKAKDTSLLNAMDDGQLNGMNETLKAFTANCPKPGNGNNPPAVVQPPKELLNPDGSKQVWNESTKSYSFVPAPTNNGGNNPPLSIPNIPQPKKYASMKEWLTENGTQQEREQQALAEEIWNQTRAALIGQLVGNREGEARQQAVEIYSRLDLPQLRALASTQQPTQQTQQTQQPATNYLGAAGAPGYQGPINEEPLLAPVYNWNNPLTKKAAG